MPPASKSTASRAAQASTARARGSTAPRGLAACGAVRVLVTGARGLRRATSGAAAARAAGTRSSRRDRELDVADAAAVDGLVARIAPDAIVHLAGVSSVAASPRTPGLACRVNFSGAHALLRGVARHAPRARVLLVSSGEVYGSAAPGAPPSTSPRRCARARPTRAARPCADLLAVGYARARPRRGAAAPLQPHRRRARATSSWRELRAPGRGDRARARASRAARSAISTRCATSSTSRTWSRPIARCSTGRAGRRLQRGERRRAAHRRRCSTRCSRARGSRPRIEVDPARFRPTDRASATPRGCAPRPAGRRGCRSRRRSSACSRTGARGSAPREQRRPALAARVLAAARRRSDAKPARERRLAERRALRLEQARERPAARPARVRAASARSSGSSSLRSRFATTRSKRAPGRARRAIPRTGRRAPRSRCRARSRAPPARRPDRGRRRPHAPAPSASAASASTPLPVPTSSTRAPRRQPARQRVEQPSASRVEAWPPVPKAWPGSITSSRWPRGRVRDRRRAAPAAAARSPGAEALLPALAPVPSGAARSRPARAPPPPPASAARTASARSAGA